jgi:hypothetical protein
MKTAQIQSKKKKEEMFFTAYGTSNKIIFCSKFTEQFYNYFGFV